MTPLRTFLERTLKKTGSITESCNGRFVNGHTSFWMDKDIPTEETDQFLVLSGDGNDDYGTWISLDQPFEIKNNALLVKDTHGNKLELEFYEHRKIELQ